MITWLLQGFVYNKNLTIYKLHVSVQSTLEKENMYIFLINTTIQFCNTGKAECIWHKNNSLELQTRKTTLLKKDFLLFW